jgi:hypothetical protein
LPALPLKTAEGQSLTPRIALDPGQLTLVPWLRIASFDQFYLSSFGLFSWYFGK